MLLAIAGGLTIALAAAPLAGAAPRYPEDFNFFSGIPYELSNPGGSLPGTNNPRCKPSAAHPRPVVLVHGTGGGQQTNWGAYGGFLANEGYCVYALTYGALPLPWPLTALGGMGAQEQSAQQLKVFIDGVLAATGAKTVDLVGHSQGTLMPSYYLKHLGGATKVTLGMVFSIMLWAPSWGGMINGLLTLRGVWDKVRTDAVLKFYVVAITGYGMATFEGPMLSLKSFNAVAHFTDCYPFVPYQFPLFQAAIRGLSLHNGFEGKANSVGERSMLGVFREVAMAIDQEPVGQLATFDRMFEGIRGALKGAIQSAINVAERHLGDEYAVRVLKALFLVKYVKEFKATLRNLSVLMLERFGDDLPAQRKRLEAALNLLEQQTYIHRNGDVYEYLTDEEKDVEEEIKNTEVETTDILKELEKPGRDPRPAFKAAIFKDGVEKVSDLKPGMILEGAVTNVAAFGAFVDVGVHAHQLHDRHAALVTLAAAFLASGGGVHEDLLGRFDPRCRKQAALPFGRSQAGAIDVFGKQAVELPGAQTVRRRAV